MRTITRDELKNKLDRGEDFLLVMAMELAVFQTGHIPGSVSITVDEISKKVQKMDEEIVVYCSGPDCFDSKNAYTVMIEIGCTNVCRYPGGISEWFEAGYPLESDEN